MNESDKTNAKRRIIFLDYLRVFAFVGVVIGHKFIKEIDQLLASPTYHVTLKAILEFLYPFFAAGGAGVVVFFMVSGYIIVHVLRSESPAEFLIKRAFRIYPLYWFAVFAEIMFGARPVPFPALNILIPRLLLIGDFTGTFYALESVEWTLRIEVLFYVFMVLLKGLGLLDGRRKWLPWIMLLTTYGLKCFGPFPYAPYLFTGYVTMYAPFLFLGTYVYLRELGEVNLLVMTGFFSFVLYQYCQLVVIYSPAWLGSNFAAAGIALFVVAWVYRSRLEAFPAVLLLSDLTYATYLFHNWAWDPIKSLFERLSINLIDADCQAFVGLLLICFILNRTIERGGILLGRRVLKRFYITKAVAT